MKYILSGEDLPEMRLLKHGKEWATNLVHYGVAGVIVLVETLAYGGDKAALPPLEPHIKVPVYEAQTPVTVVAIASGRGTVTSSPTSSTRGTGTRYQIPGEARWFTLEFRDGGH